MQHTRSRSAVPPFCDHTHRSAPGHAAALAARKWDLFRGCVRGGWAAPHHWHCLIFSELLAPTHPGHHVQRGGRAAASALLARDAKARKRAEAEEARAGNVWAAQGRESRRTTDERERPVWKTHRSQGQQQPRAARLMRHVCPAQTLEQAHELLLLTNTELVRPQRLRLSRLRLRGFRVFCRRAGETRTLRRRAAAGCWEPWWCGRAMDVAAASMARQGPQTPACVENWGVFEADPRPRWAGASAAGRRAPARAVGSLRAVRGHGSRCGGVGERWIRRALARQEGRLPLAALPAGGEALPLWQVEAPRRARLCCCRLLGRVLCCRRPCCSAAGGG